MPPPAPLADIVAPLRADPERTAILLDVDGTLAPIVRDPLAATVPERTRRLVHGLTGRYGLVGCVTGRRATAARQMLGIGTIPYAGNHGAELLTRGAPVAQVDPDAARWAERVRAVLDLETLERLRDVGVREEDKGPIVALHWRGAENESAAQEAARAVGELARQRGLDVHEGRRVLELRAPVRIGKDRAVRRLLDGSATRAALYVGDDRTDVDAFAGLRELVAAGRLDTAVCVAVASDETPSTLLDAADAVVDGTAGVRELLELLLA